LTVELPQRMQRRLWRAVIEFDLLQPGDRVLVGLSGGKDSSFLLYGLASLRKDAPFDFELAALHVDQGFVEDFDVSPMEELCRRLEVSFHVKRTSIYTSAFNHESQNPCAQCAYLRRGFMNKYAREHGYNKVALAHHLDDAVETFLMSQLYSAQLETFMPSSYLDRMGITVIRPLVYFRENEIKTAGKKLALPTVDSPCPMAGRSKRAVVKKLLFELCRENKLVYNNLVTVMRAGVTPRQWPADLPKEQLRGKMEAFWGGKGRNQRKDRE
jgi:tRNA 2-thiocytidine biosynthesis protein TtcA